MSSYVVLRGSAQAARFTLDTLPLVRPHRLHHVLGELKASRVAWTEEGARTGNAGVSASVLLRH